MTIRTTEPVQATDGGIYPSGTTAVLIGPSEHSPWGDDFRTEEGAILWGLVPSQYEIEEEGR